MQAARTTAADRSVAHALFDKTIDLEKKLTIDGHRQRKPNHIELPKRDDPTHRSSNDFTGRIEKNVPKLKAITVGELEWRMRTLSGLEVLLSDENSDYIGDRSRKVLLLHRNLSLLSFISPAYFSWSLCRSWSSKQWSSAVRTIRSESLGKIPRKGTYSMWIWLSYSQAEWCC